MQNIDLDLVKTEGYGIHENAAELNSRVSIGHQKPKVFSAEKWFIILSIVAHSLVLLLLLKTSGNIIPAQNLINESPLKSYLYSPPIPSVFPEEKAVVREQDTATQVPSPAIMNKPANIDKKSIEQAEPAVINKIASPESVASKPVTTKTEQAEILHNKTELPPIERSSQRYQLNKERLDNAVKNYQRSIDNAAINNIAQEQAREYQLRKTSPLLDIPELPSREERAATLRKRVVDCSNKAKLGITILTSLMGGTVQCRKHNNAQEFIDKRLNKGVKEKDKTNPR